MSADARIATGLPAHPKTKKLIRRLGEGAAWRLVCLFLWVASNRSDGDLAGLTDEDIELAVDWTGEDGQFAAALVEVGFLDGSEGDYSIHDWNEHNPWAAGAEARSEKAKWAALCKHEGRKEAAKKMPDYAKRLLDASKEPTETVPDSAISKLDALPDSASSTPLAGSSCAPSPSPSPSPIQEQDQKQKGGRPPALTLPDWLPESAWLDWHAFRNSRKGWTHKARELSLAKLTKLRTQGHDPTAVIEQSIERGWTGLFEPKNETGGNHDHANRSAGSRTSVVERIKANNAAADERERRVVHEGQFARIG